LFIVIIGAGLIVTGISSILESVLQSRSSFGYIGLAHVGLSVVQAGAGFWVVSSGGSIAALATTFLVSNFTFLVLLLIGIFRRQPLGRLRIDPAFWLSQARLSLPYAGTAIMMIISMRCELLIMSSVSSAEQVAFFSVAARLNDAAILAPMVLATVLVPQYSRHHHEAPGVLTRSYSAVLRWGLLIAIPVAIVAALLIGPVISALLPAYGSSARLAAIMFATMPLFAVYQLNFAVFLSSDGQGRTMMTLAGLLLVQLVFGFVLIPPHAADGAAMSYALWTLAAAVVSTGLAKHWYMKDLCVLRVVAPAVTGGLAMGAVLWMIWDAHMAIKLVVAIGSYAAATLAVLRIQSRSTVPGTKIIPAD
jgi:O-antigen/teichoic acid export membrane protein